MDKKLKAYFAQIGRKGGKSKSEAKVRAARKNGRKALKRTVLMLVSVSLYSGCTGLQNIRNSANSWASDRAETAETKERERAYNTQASTWEGRDINDVIQAVGYPTRTFNLPNGNTVYAYEKSQVYTYPTTTSPVNARTYHSGGMSRTTVTGGHTFGGQTVNQWCNAYFETKSNMIVTWRYEGNACN